MPPIFENEPTTIDKPLRSQNILFTSLYLIYGSIRLNIKYMKIQISKYVVSKKLHQIDEAFYFSMIYSKRVLFNLKNLIQPILLYSMENDVHGRFSIHQLF